MRCLKANELLKLVYTYNQAAEGTMGITGIAKLIGVSSKYLSMFIAEKTGKRFSEIRTYTRINHAKELLRDTYKNLKPIARECGFKSDASFSRCFKKTTGITPGHYRSRKQRCYDVCPVCGGEAKGGARK